MLKAVASACTFIVAAGHRSISQTAICCNAQSIIVIDCIRSYFRRTISSTENNWGINNVIVGIYDRITQQNMQFVCIAVFWLDYVIDRGWKENYEQSCGNVRQNQGVILYTKI